MGGNLFETSRVSPERYNQITKSVLEKLSCDSMKVVPHFKDKSSFGDLDIVCPFGVGFAKDLIDRVFNNPKCSVNDSVISFLYMDFQIDVICMSPLYFEMALAYFSYNDLGNILGRIFHKMGLKFGHSGLIYPVRIDSIVGEVLVSRDMRMILAYLGLGPGRWKKGFDTLDDIFLYVSKSKYFDPDIFDPEINAHNRKKNAKRTTFQRFVKWIEANNPSKNHEFESDKTKYLLDIADFFGYDILDRIDGIRENGLRKQELSNRFRGELFMEITGLKGQDLGAFISYYKNIYSGFTDLKTDSWEFTASQDEIRYDIEQKYAEYKKNILHGDIA